MSVFLAQQPTGLGGPIGGPGLGPFAEIFGAKEAMGKFAGAISAIVGFLTIVAGLWFIFQFIIGAIQWLASSGDKAALTTAQQKLTNSFIGLILVVAAIAVVKLVGVFLGFDILDPGKFIDAIRFK